MEKRAQARGRQLTIIHQEGAVVCIEHPEFRVPALGDDLLRVDQISFCTCGVERAEEPSTSKITFEATAEELSLLQGAIHKQAEEMEKWKDRYGPDPVNLAKGAALRALSHRIAVACIKAAEIELGLTDRHPL